VKHARATAPHGLHALYERGIAPDLLIGTSAGALNAAFLASRPATVATAQELAAVWRGLRRSDILPLRPATLLSGLAGRRDHLIPDQALRRLAARHLQRVPGRCARGGRGSRDGRDGFRRRAVAVRTAGEWTMTVAARCR
jgi:predicted acylesterase/phospholipase RssA